VIIIAAAQYQQKEDYVSSSNLSGSPKEIEFAGPGQATRLIPMIERGYAAALQRLMETTESS
jgi:hypothetical protein